MRPMLISTISRHRPCPERKDESDMKLFTDPELEIIRFGLEDVIATSSGTGTIEEIPDVNNGLGWG